MYILRCVCDFLIIPWFLCENNSVDLGVPLIWYTRHPWILSSRILALRSWCWQILSTGCLSQFLASRDDTGKVARLRKRCEEQWKLHSIWAVWSIPFASLTSPQMSLHKKWPPFRILGLSIAVQGNLEKHTINQFSTSSWFSFRQLSIRKFREPWCSILGIVLYFWGSVLKPFESTIKHRHRFSKIAIRIEKRRCAVGTEVSEDAVSRVLCFVHIDFDHIFTTGNAMTLFHAVLRGPRWL